YHYPCSFSTPCTFHVCSRAPQFHPFPYTTRSRSYGYIILPIAVPASQNPATALNDNKKYKIVWDVLQTLRAHDDRFEAMVNKIRSEEHTSELQSRENHVCRLLHEKKKIKLHPTHN